MRLGGPSALVLGLLYMTCLAWRPGVRTQPAS